MRPTTSGLVSIVLATAILSAHADAQAPLPAFSVADAAVDEGNSGSSTLSFIVTRTPGTGRSTVRCEIANGTAQAGSDFIAVAPVTLDFAAGETAKTVAVTITGDTTTEPNETLALTLSSPFSATIADGSATGTIRNDDVPSFSVNDFSVPEGAAGTTTPLVLTISRNGTGIPSTVVVATENRTAQAGTDYVAIEPTTIRFASGDTAKQVTITINGDSFNEAHETFNLILSSPAAATIADGAGLGTIRNDDETLVSVGDIEVEEGNVGTRLLNFPITRSGDLSGPTSVFGATLGKTASPGVDFVAFSQGRTDFAPNQSSGTMSVTVNSDGNSEPDETLELLISAQGATVTDDTGLGTIRNDDFQFALFSIRAVFPFPEGSSGPQPVTFRINRTEFMGNTPSVKFLTANGTATGGSDFVAVAPTVVNFAANEEFKDVTVTVNGDTVFEQDEVFGLRLIDATGARIVNVDAFTDVHLRNDDAGLNVSDAVALEEDAATTPGRLTFTVSRVGNLALESSVVCTPTNGTAASGSDFTPLSPTTVTFPSGHATKTVVVNVLSDSLVEGEENFTLLLSSPVNATILDGSGLGRIVDNDNPPLVATLSVNDISVLEEGGTATFTVTRSGDLSATSSASYTVASSSNVDGVITFGSASATQDFVGTTANPLGFSPGVATRTVSVSVRADDTPEGDETFHLTLFNPSGATITDPTGRATILDNDDFRLSVQGFSVPEGNSGATTLTINVHRLPLGQATTSVNYSIGGGSATSGTDYIARTPSGTLIWSGSEAQKSIEVIIAGDTIGEPDETILITLTNPVNALLPNPTGVFTIVNDDVSLAVSDSSVAEGKSGDQPLLRFTVTRTGPSTGTVSVQYATANVNAGAGSDYAATRGTLTFAPGEVHRVVTVSVIADNINEPNETLTLNLSAASGASIIDGTGVGTILNDD